MPFVNRVDELAEIERLLLVRSGFTDDLLVLARDPSQRLLLFTPDDLWR